MNWIKALWYRRCRSLDMKILWPSCRLQARDLDHARKAFAVHAFNDPAWLVLCEEDIKEIISNLS